MSMLSNKKSVKNQEKDFAKTLGGKRQKMSGAHPDYKGDVLSEEFLGEAKQTANKSLTIKEDWLVKIDNEAMACNKMPIMSLKFLNMNLKTPNEWYLMPKYVFEILFDAYNEIKKVKK